MSTEKHSNGFVMEYTDELGKTIKVTVEGETEIPFWKHDLKLKAAIGLIESVDYKDFANENKEDLYFELMEKLKKTINQKW